MQVYTIRLLGFKCRLLLPFRRRIFISETMFICGRRLRVADNVSGQNVIYYAVFNVSADICLNTPPLSYDPLFLVFRAKY